MAPQAAKTITPAGTELETVYINELLCYVTYSHKSNNDRFHREIINLKFDDKDIIDAKKLLWELGKEVLTDKCPQRQNSRYRDAKIIHIEDIFEAIKDLDAANKLPIFVAKELSSLPDLQPEELNVLFFIKRIKALEVEAKQHREELTTLNRHITQVNDDQSMQKTQAETQKEDLVTVNRTLSQVKQAFNNQIKEVKSQIQTQLDNINSFFNKQCSEVSTNTSNTEVGGVTSKGICNTNTDKESTSVNTETFSDSPHSTPNNEQCKSNVEGTGAVTAAAAETAEATTIEATAAAAVITKTEAVATALKTGGAATVPATAASGKQQHQQQHLDEQVIIDISGESEVKVIHKNAINGTQLCNQQQQEITNHDSEQQNQNIDQLIQSYRQAGQQQNQQQHQQNQQNQQQLQQGQQEQSYHQQQLQQQHQPHLQYQQYLQIIQQ